MKNIYLDRKYFDHYIKNDLRECDIRKIINSTIASSSMPSPKGKVFINMNSAQIKNEILEPSSSISMYRRLFQQVNTKYWSKFSDEEGVIEQIKNQNFDNIINLGFSLCIIDINAKTALEIRENYGSLVFSIDELKSEVRIVSDKKTIVPPKRYQDSNEPNTNCYKYLFNSIYKLNQKTNSILIMDPYLFNENNEDLIIKNLKCILEFTLPHKLHAQVSMNIGIIVSRFRDPLTKNNDTFKRKFENNDSDLHKKIRSLKDIKEYKFNFQILFLNEHNRDNKKFHKRFIITNNYKIEFNNNTSIILFNTKNEPKHKDRIEIESIFNYELDEFDIDIEYLKDIKYLSEKYDYKVYDMIDQKENVAFTNPIFKSI